MMTKKENKKNYLTAYGKLDPVKKGVVEILSVGVDFLPRKYLFSCLDSLGIYDEDKQGFTYATIRPVLANLESRGFILSVTKGVKVPEPLCFQVVRELVKARDFTKIAHALLQASPFSVWNGKYRFETDKLFLRALQMAMFGTKELVDMDAVYTFGKKAYPMAFQEKPPVLQLFNYPFDPELMQNIPPAVRWKTVEYCFMEAGRHLKPVPDLADHCLKLFSKRGNDLPHARVQNILLEFFLLSGRQDACNTILSASDSPSTPSRDALMGWMALIHDNTESALNHFQRGLDHLKKESPRRKVFFKGYGRLFYLFALLKSAHPLNYEIALDLIGSLLSNKKPLCMSALKALKYILKQRLGIQDRWHKEILYYGIEGKEPIEAVFNILAVTWLDKEIVRPFIPKLEEIREKTNKCGYVWVEAEISGILACLGEDAAANEKRSRQLHKKAGTTSLVNMVDAVPRWEMILESLMHMAAKDAGSDDGATPENEQRLVWVMKHNEQYHISFLTPRLQKISKTGKWTKGRPVALKKLYRNPAGMPGLTEQDRQICLNAIKESHYGNSYYGKIEYAIDETRAFPLLVGHPLVFLEESLTTPVELVPGEPEVRIRVRENKIHISMEPEFDSEVKKDIHVVRETPSRFKVISLSDTHLRIAELMGDKGVEIPKKAGKKLTRAMTALSSLVAVNSDLGDAGDDKIKKITAGDRIYAHVMPWQQGIKVEFLVQPVDDVQSFFKPGRGGSHVFLDIKGEKIQAVRDLKREKKREKAIVEACPSLDFLEPVAGEWLVGEPEDALELLLDLKACPEDLVLAWPQGEKMQVRSRVSFDEITLNIKKDRDWFKATGSVVIDENLSIDLKKMMALLERPLGRFVTLDDGTFLAITHSLKERLEELRAYSTVHGKGLRFTPLAAPAIEELTGQVGSLKTDKAWKSHCNKLKKVVDPQIPGTLQARPRDYQVTGFKWLARLAHWQVGACLADDMGLGKTLQALSLILLHAAKGPTLVVAPLSVAANWQDECHHFAPTLNPLVFGPGDRQAFLDDLGPFDLVISSYGLLQVEAEKLAGVAWQVVVLDEAQAIKNMKSKRSRAAMKLSARFRMITTGTPVENHLDELWTLFNFLNPGLLGTFKRFKEIFALPNERDQDKDASRRLRKLIRPFILRRLKSDVLTELPRKTEITLNVEMSPEEAVLYEAQRLKALENIEQADEGPGRKHLRILAELMKLRQLCCNPSLVLPKAGIESSKLKVFGDVVTELLANQHKALVFSQFVGHLNILRGVLDDKKISYQYLDGSTSARERQARINAFQNGEGDLFLISLKAGGFGLNLTAADYVIHMDPWWNPAVEDQASDRAHRMGQTRPVTVYRLVVKGSIEEQIVKLHKEKRDLAQGLLAGGDMAGKMSASELLSLLKEN
ncbi:Superfamily II DNA or RNA helicase, SNF2 family [Desulfocicer vacuolatum DSM 3385]|uniref:Superfamily II DNA or RNA helicase, SNF2 family n=1 Tax=Desulfocicer vacuolatum DSM 3385 TaxID=1121400 RepID=A0A1W2EET9_9BACT|nr:DEAD/DEAH box helicase [Desulfocicer vacuolatum]SMD08264.1 Superfamily II DNA or RNA helicase, SNF2 family [Desulfocicer vacuolatum DSM 3385]